MACPYQEYFCIGCYWRTVHKYSLDYITDFCCWGLGYAWCKNPTREMRFPQPEAGAACFTGLCCLRCGNSSDVIYDHKSENNIYKSTDIYSPCGYCSKEENLYSKDITYNVYTPCCKFETTVNAPPKTTVVPVSIQDSVTGMTKEPRTDSQESTSRTP